MAELATLARPYAEAVFELARDTERLENWSDTLGFLKAVIQDEEFVAIANNPTVSRETLLTLLLDIGEQYLDEAGRNLVKMLVANHRLPILPCLADQYEVLRAEHQGVLKVEVISTYAVKPQQKQQIEEMLKKRFGKQVEVEVEIDRKLLGGWLIRAGAQVLDLSVRGRLQQLASELR